MGKIKLFSLLFLLIFCMCVFAKEKIKTFDENYICSEDDIEYSDYMEYEKKASQTEIKGTGI